MKQYFVPEYAVPVIITLGVLVLFLVQFLIVSMVSTLDAPDEDSAPPSAFAVISK
jgi:hypothetical protein